VTHPLVVITKAAQRGLRIQDTARAGQNTLDGLRTVHPKAVATNMQNTVAGEAKWKGIEARKVKVIQEQKYITNRAAEAIKTEDFRSPVASPRSPPALAFPAAGSELSSESEFVVVDAPTVPETATSADASVGPSHDNSSVPGVDAAQLDVAAAPTGLRRKITCLPVIGA